MGFFDVLSALVGPVLSFFGQERANKANAEQVQQNQEWQEKIIAQQNEYNSPDNQMTRLQSAGINPATYGMASGNIVSGNLSGSPNAVPVIPMSNSLGNLSSDLSHIMTAFKSGQEGLSDKTFRQARLDEIESQIDKFKAETELLGLDSANQAIVNQFTAAEKTFAIAESQGRIRKLRSEFDMNYSQIAVANQSIKRMQYELENVFPEEVKKIISERELNVLRLDEIVASIADLKASAELKGEQRNTEEIRQSDLLQDVAGKSIENANKQELIDKYIERYGAEIRKLGADAGLTEEQTYWYVFDEISKGDIQLLGTRISRTRFGEKKFRKSFESAVDDKLFNR